MKRLTVTVAMLGMPFLAAACPSAVLDDAALLELYKTKCLACHLADGNAQVKEMNLADGEWKHGSRLVEIRRVIEEGVSGTAMFPFRAQLSAQEIEGLARFIRAFDKTLQGTEARR